MVDKFTLSSLREQLKNSQNVVVFTWWKTPIAVFNRRCNRAIKACPIQIESGIGPVNIGIIDFFGFRQILT